MFGRIGIAVKAQGIVGQRQLITRASSKVPFLPRRKLPADRLLDNVRLVGRI
jgi:hypothetical protein